MLAPDTLLGPYRIVGAIGAGGMGEVYRAVDTRLEREVAVKVLTEHLANDRESLRRFEQEARAAGMLNHPNIMAVYDIGVEGERRYIVSELLEGESLRARLRAGAVSPRKAIDIAQQVARGLAAAHEKGIIHRDLKPENVFVTRDGQVKILDFGLVKLMAPRVPGVHPHHPQLDDTAPTLPGTPTEPGRLLGTVGYMAPEQIRGQPGDHRSDIFAFGAMLYEMLTGRQPFRGDSPIETLNSILKDDPPDVAEINPRIPAAIDRVVRHCLEKNPEERFQSARDVAFDLGALSGLTSQAIFRPSLRNLHLRDLTKPLIYLAVATAIAATAFFLGRQHGLMPPPRFHRLTYRSGTVFNARFSPDGQTVFYGARWSGQPITVYSIRADSPESRDLGFGVADVLSVSRSGQLAISLRRRPVGFLRDRGTLAQVAIAGGAPRELAEDVEFADWAPDSRTLAVVRSVSGKARLEYPIGKMLYETDGWIAQPRFNPHGDTIAFVDHPFANDDRGSIAIIPAAGGAKKLLTPESQSADGLAWSPDGDEIWFTADRGSGIRTLNAVTLRGKERALASSAGSLWLQDVASDGRVLLARDLSRGGILASFDGDKAPRDLSWLDFSIVRDLSADGKTIVFSESGEAGGSIFGVYLRRTDGSPAIRLGDGTTEALSPDGQWVLSVPRNRKPAPVMMLPTGAGEPRVVTHDTYTHRNVRWFPDGQRILFQGGPPSGAPRLWVQDVKGGAPRAISPEGVAGTQVTADGTHVLGRMQNGAFFLFPADGASQPVPVPALRGSDVPVRFSSDGKSIFVGTFGRIPAELTKVDLATAARTPIGALMPPDAAGLINVGPIFVTPDGKNIVYSYSRLLSDVYLVSGVH